MTRILIPFVYFIAGASSLAGVATTFFLKDDLALTIPQVSLIASVGIIPWSIKPLYGFASDRFPIWRLRRKPYLFLAGLLGSGGYLAMGLAVESFQGALIATIFSAFGFALADVIVDSIVVEESRTQKEAGKLQSLCRIAIMMGALLVAYLSGVLVEAVGARSVFLITGVLPLCTSLFAVFLPEHPTASATFDLRETWRTIRSACTPALLWSTLFIFLWRATPSSGAAFNYFVIDELGFTPEFFGVLSMLSYLMGIVGILLFRTLLLSLPLRTLFFWITVISVLLSLPGLGLIYGWYELLGVSPQFFSVADTLVTGPLSELLFLPILVLAARLCPKGMEGTMFAILASVMNIGLAVSDMGGGFLAWFFDVHQATELLPANYAHLDLVVWIAILSSFIPLPLLRFIPDTRAKDELPEASPSMQQVMRTPLEPGKEEVA